MQLDKKEKVQLVNGGNPRWLTKLFKKSEIKEQYQQEKNKIEQRLRNRMAEINEFLDENTPVKNLKDSEVEKSFDICLKKFIMQEAVNILFQEGKVDLKSVITEELFNEIFDEASLEAYITLLRERRCVASAYPTAKDAEMILRQEFGQNDW